MVKMKHTQMDFPVVILVMTNDVSTWLENTQRSDEETRWRQKMVAIHKCNWRKLQEQLAVYQAGDKPLHLLNQVELEEEAIRQYGGVV